MTEFTAPIARYKDLCIDVGDARAEGPFWAGLLGLALHDEYPRLSGEQPQQVVWLNEVPEPKTVKNRVHLDVYASSLDEAIALGARKLADFDRWTVMAAPDGQEFCIFVQPEPPVRRLKDLVVDSTDPEPIARWWTQVFGGVLGASPDHPWWWCDQVPGAPFDSIDFVQVPESKTTKNRVHWDVRVSDPQRLVDAGAELLRPKGGDIGWHVLADPDGNEFCAFDD